MLYELKFNHWNQTKRSRRFIFLTDKAVALFQARKPGVCSRVASARGLQSYTRMFASGGRPETESYLDNGCTCSSSLSNIFSVPAFQAWTVPNSFCS